MQIKRTLNGFFQIVDKLSFLKKLVLKKAKWVKLFKKEQILGA
jgi:hypothetical protein